MKIRKLTIKNLNSVYGTWKIDFLNPAYENNPLFAIVGKTGSGKSTILDAICFALYDQTDRMGETRSEFASRHTAECMAELEFELNGKIYVAHSSLKCASKGPREGEYAQGLADSWLQCGDEKIAHNTSLKKLKIKELLGLDFVQFRQVILLAQGKFNAFLNETGDKRATILESITGAEIYTKIGEKIKGKCKEARDGSNSLSTQIKAMQTQTLPEAEINRKENRLGEINAALTRVRQELQTLEEQLATASRLQDANGQLARLTQEDDELKTAEKAFEAKRPKLESARTAAKVTEAYNAFESIRMLQKQNTDERETLQNELPGLQDIQKNARAESDNKNQAFLDCQKKQQEREEFLKQIDSLDQEISRLKVDAEKETRLCQRLEKEKQSILGQIDLQNKAIDELTKQKGQADVYLKEHQKDKDLAVKTAEWNLELQAIDAAKKNLVDCQKAEKSKGKKLEQAKQQLNDAQARLAEKEQAWKKSEQALNAAERALAAALDGHSLEALKVAREKQANIVAILKALRPREVLETFEEGKPCPVCGALHHPYRQKQFEQSSELLSASELLKQEQDKYETAQKASEKQGKAKNDQAMAMAELQSARETLQVAKDNALEKQTEYDEHFAKREEKENGLALKVQSLQESLAVFSLAWDGKGELPAAISERREKFAEQEALANGFEKRQGELQAVLAGRQGELNGKEEAQGEANERLREKSGILDEQSRERREKYQDRKTADERDALQKEIGVISAQKEKATQNLTKATANVANHERRIAELTRRISERANEFAQKQQALDDALKVNDLTIPRYLDTRLEQGELNSLVKEETDLASHREALNQRMKELNELIDRNQKLLPEGFEAEQAKTAKGDLQNLQAALNTEAGRLKEVLDANKKNRDLTADLQKKWEEANLNTRRWEQLDSWLGGQNFMKMAQSFTLDTLLGKANDQLRNMLQGRYLLCLHDGNDKLEIDVVDNQLGGDVRSSKNLSGGEQFVVSMALALGLASMVGEKLSIDSLFLDEGFGTLDGNELEEAMTTLSQLKGNGKLVGIITHAERLQERIPTRISLEKQGNGRSVLEGPGVQLIEKPELYMSTEEKNRLKALEKERMREERRARKASKGSST
ncbi:MAG: hypothetical protein IJJ33_15405 [Victivallales bacterium]|nr:hypothetical protein [Victivallales bacterium]